MFRITEPTKLQDITKLDPSIINKTSARFRLIHNVASGPIISTYIDENLVFKDISFETITNYVEMSSGDHSIFIKTNDKIIINGKFTLQKDVSYTFIVYGLTNNQSTNVFPLLIDDTLDCPEQNRTHIRLINAESSFGPIDGYINGVKVFPDMSYLKLVNPEYISIPYGTYDFVLTRANTNIPILNKSIRFKNGGIYTLVTSGLINDPKSPQTVLISEDTQGSCIIIGL